MQEKLGAIKRWVGSSEETRHIISGMFLGLGTVQWMIYHENRTF